MSLSSRLIIDLVSLDSLELTSSQVEMLLTVQQVTMEHLTASRLWSGFKTTLPLLVEMHQMLLYLENLPDQV